MSAIRPRRTMLWLGRWFCSYCRQACRAFSLPPSMTAAVPGADHARAPSAPSLKLLPPTAHVPGVILQVFLKRPWPDSCFLFRDGTSRLIHVLHTEQWTRYGKPTVKILQQLMQQCKGSVPIVEQKVFIQYRDVFLRWLDPGRGCFRISSTSNKNKTVIPTKSR